MIFVNHTNNTFDQGNDVSEELKILVKTYTSVRKTMLKISSNTDARIKEREYKQVVMDYKAELDESMRRKRKYKENMYKLYALLW